MKIYKILKNTEYITWNEIPPHSGIPVPVEAQVDLTFEREDMISDPISYANDRIRTGEGKPSMYIIPEWTQEWAKRNYAIFKRQDRDMVTFFAIKHSKLVVETSAVLPGRWPHKVREGN